MEEKRRYEQDYDEISLRELIEVLLKEKILIVGITFAMIVFAAVYTLGILKPVYESKALLTINLQESLSTPYGTFNIPLKTVAEYTEIVKGSGAIQLTLKDMDYSLTREQVLDRIDVETIKDTNSFRLKVKAGSPGEAFNLANIHTNNYLMQLEIILKRMAIDNFYNNAVTSLRSLEKSLLSNEEDLLKTRELLNKTPKTIELENALISEADYALIYSSMGGVDLDAIRGDKIINQELNPSYLKIMSQITDLELHRNNLENNLEVSKRNLEELQQEKDDVNQYIETLSVEQLSSDLSASMRNLVTIINRPEIESQKVAPRNASNLAIGGVLGLMLGVIVAFFKNYWENS